MLFMSDVIFLWLVVAYDFSILLYFFVYHIAFVPFLAFMSSFGIPSVLVFHFTTFFIGKLGKLCYLILMFGLGFVIFIISSFQFL